MTQTSSETPVLDLLATMTADSLEMTTLPLSAIMSVRLAALVATDAPPVSYALNLEAADEAGLGVEEIRGILMAIAPVVGTARVMTATARIVEAIGIALEVATVEMDAAADR